MKYVPGLLAGQLSGKAGSTVASHNRNGSYFRTRTIPVDPATPAQLVNRNNVHELSQIWKTLTAIAQAAWTSLGAQMTRLDRQGVAYTLTGFQAFLSVNRNLRAFAIADLLVAPAMPSSPTLTTLSGTPATDNTFPVAYTPTPIGANIHMVIRATAPVSPGISFQPRSAYKDILHTGANAASPQAIGAAYSAIFGTLAGAEGSKIFFEAALCTNEGFMGTPLKATAIVEIPA